MICQACGVEAPTRYVAFYQNIGVLVIRFHRGIKGNLCKNCVHKYFWKYTLYTLFGGWWGMISFVVTPFFLLNNFFRYVTCLGMPAVPPDAERPTLTDEAIRKIKPHVDDLVERLNAGEKLEEVAEDIADLAGVTPGQVFLYARALMELSRKKRR